MNVLKAENKKTSGIFVSKRLGRGLATIALGVALTCAIPSVGYANNGSTGTTTVQPIMVMNQLNASNLCNAPYTNFYNCTVAATTSGASINFNSQASAGISFFNVSNASFAQGGAVAMDVTNPTSSPSTFLFIVHDTGSGYLQNVVTIPANSTQTVAMSLSTFNPATTYGMSSLPSPYPGVQLYTAYTGETVNVNSISNISIVPQGSNPASQLVVGNIRLMPSVNWTTYLTGLIDAYGQSTLSTWPTKLTNPSQFASRLAAEQASFTNLLGSSTDSYGGSLSLPHQTATGHFRTAQVNGKWWLVTPAGNLFFMNGADYVGTTDPTLVSGRQAMFQSLPSSGSPLAQNYATSSSGTTYDFYFANLQNKYGSNWMPSFVSSVTNRMHTWGLNTLGSFTNSTVTASANLPHFDLLGIYGSFNKISCGANVWGELPDPYDPAFAAAANAEVQSAAAMANSDPNLIGFVVDSEPTWVGNTGTAADVYALAISTLAQNAATSPAKAKLVQILEKKYARINLLNMAWNTHFASYAALSLPYTAPQSLTAAMQRDLTIFVGDFAQQYFSTVRAAIKKYTPNTLYFGSSLSAHDVQAQCMFSAPVVAAEAANCDGFAFNYYGQQIPSTITNLTQQYNLPIVLTEFNFSSASDGIFGTDSATTMPDQNTRAAAYTNFVNSLLVNPQFVGCNFYLWADMPTAGQTGAQNNLQGFVDVTDTPYPTFISAIQSLATGMYQTRWNN